MSIVERIKLKIKDAVAEKLEKQRQEGTLNYGSVPEFVIEVPREKSHGDFAANIALVLAKEARMSPRKIAELIVADFSGAEDWLEKIEVAGPGFLNFYLRPEWLYEVLAVTEEEGENYGSSSYGAGQKIQVEFVSANPTGLLHMGNARGAALGDSLSNLLEKAGYEVTREFYINDAGNQIENFGKSLEARYYQELGHEYPFPEEGYHGEDIIDTVRGIIAAKGDSLLTLSEEERREKLAEIALVEKVGAIEKTLREFGVEYDNWFKESSLHEAGAVKKAITYLEEKDYVYTADGALWFRNSRLNPNDKDEVVFRSNGLPTYFAADIAYHQNKFERGYDRVINIWGADHHGHVARMKGAVDALGYDSERLTVILMQLVRLFKDGEILRMSKRTGQYITLEELIEEVGRDAARYFFIMRSPDSHLDFDLDLAKKESTENPVYYVQYAHARICSILQAAGRELPRFSEIKPELLREESEFELLRKIADLPDEIREAAAALEPHRLARYAGELASLFHSFYNNCKVLGEDAELSAARLLLADAARLALRNVLQILGVSAPDRM